MTSDAPSVIVFGSLHYDILVKGPARPKKGETLTGSAWSPACGGKGGNQAVAAAMAGVSVAMLGAVGDDQFGQALLAHLDRHGVDRRYVRTTNAAGSGMSVAIFDAEGDYGAVIVSGSNNQLSEHDVLGAAPVFHKNAILVLQNEVPEAANIHAARAMKRAGGRVIWNAAPVRTSSPDMAALVDILVVNAIEAEALADVPQVNSLEDAVHAAEILAQNFAVAVVTAGSEGVAYAEQGTGKTAAFPAVKVKLVSTHGAGDTFIGVLAARLAQHVPFEDALVAANAAAAALVAQAR